MGHTDKEVAVPSFRRRASVIDADRADEPCPDSDPVEDLDPVLALAEEAEAEAAEAEAMAAAARARARAIRLRREADSRAAAAAPATEAQTAEPTEDTVEASDAGVAEPTEAESVDDAAPRRRPGWRRVARYVAAALGVLATCALIAATVFMVIQHRSAVHDEQQRAEFAAAGRQAVVTLMSLDFNNAQQNVDRIIDNSTGQFRDDFKNTAGDFVKIAKESKVVTDVSVNASAVDSMSGDSADVLVAATSRVTNSSGAKEQPRSWRLLVSLVREGGQIKMSKVEFVP
jgi:Mce-associated membrane protein